MEQTEHAQPRPRNSQELLTGLIEVSLDPAAFSHRDHVAAAFGALERFEFFTAMQVYADGLRALTVKAGVPEKFNATVTLAFISLIAEKMAEGYDDADAMLAAHPELLRRDLLGAWYSKGRISSDLARRVAVLPDRIVALNS